jgi:RHS repeat-associated protein
MRIVRLLCLLMLFFGISTFALAQDVGTGLYSLGSFDSRGFDTINIGNLNTHFEIPIVTKQGRGINFDYSLVYDGLVWSTEVVNGVTQWEPDSTFGFHGQLGSGLIGYTTFSEMPTSCPNGGTTHSQNLGVKNFNYIYHDPFGRSHLFNYSETVCASGDTVTGNGSTSDGSGYSLNLNNLTVNSRSGVVINASLNATTVDSTTATITDTNGNTITNNGNGTFTDTVGVPALTIGGTGTVSSPLTFTYPVAKQSGSATSATTSVNYKTYTVQTAFECSGISEFGPTSTPLVDHITLPDASASTYSFTYEPTPGVSGAVTGRLASVTLPTGGVIRYSYTDGGCNGTSGINADGTPGSLTRVTGDSTSPRSYTRGPINSNATSTTVQDEKGNQSVYQFTISSGLFYETERAIYQGTTSGTNLLNQYTCYNGASPSCNGAAITLPISETIALTSYNNGTQLGTTNLYDASGMLTSSTQTSGSTILQTTANVYNALEEISSSKVTDGSGITMSYTTYGYDEYTVTPLTTTSGIPQHGAAPGTASSTRGNQTSAHIQLASGEITTTTAYYDTGMPVSVTTPNGKTSYTYDPTQTFATATALPTPSSGVALATSASYDPTSGVQLSATGMNPGQTTQITQYDPLLRPTAATLPSGSNVTASYSPNGIGQYQTMSSTETAQTQTELDSYGRTSRVAVYNGQSSNPWYQVDYCYDATGLLQFQSAKYQGTGFAGANASKQCSGNGTSYVYDGLGRVTSSTNADGTTSWTYTGRAVKTTDVNGVIRITQYDMLGRLSGICEVVTYTSVIGSPAPAACGMDIAGSGYKTAYTYSGDTTTITQGAQQRQFQTDWAGRTISTIEPERGPTNYSYTYNSTGLAVTRSRPKANQNSPTVLTTTTTQYDSLSRPVSVTYNDNLTPTKTFVYDTPCCWSNESSATNLKGRLAVMGSGTGATGTGTLFSYDVTGNVTAMWECAPSICGTASQLSRGSLNFGYDWAGNLAYASDGASGIIVYGRSPAGEVTSITNQSYTNAPFNPPNLVSNIVNGPNGPLSYTLGNGLTGVKSYDSMGRLNGGFVCNGSSAASCTGGTQIYGFTATWKGSQLQGSCDTVLNVCSNFVYDQFNRLATSTVTQGPGPTQNFWYVEDIYGNRWQQNVTAGTGPAPSIAFNAINNQITTAGYAYDYPGNLTSDGLHTYTYDAEGNVLSVDGGSTAQYTYDAMNRRVRVQTASSTNEYSFNYAGQRTSTWQVSNNDGDEGRIYWGGQQIAFRDVDGTTYFDHQNWLGTERLRTNYAGAIAASYVSLPWGDGYAPSVVTPNGDQDNLHFAQLEHDSESTTEHAQFRQLSSAQGRWMSPDPYDGSYDATNPQSLNRYAYVLNNPLSATDPLGLFLPAPILSGGGGGGGTLICNTYTYSTDAPGSPTGGAPDPPTDGSGDARPHDSGTQTECFVLYSSTGNLPNIPQINLPPLPTTTRTYAPSNVPKPAQVLHFWQKPGCGSAIGETAIGAVATGGLAAGIWFLGPEALAIAGEAVVETAVTEGPLAAGMDVTHLVSAAGVLAAAPLVTLGNGISNVAASCF